MGWAKRRIPWSASSVAGIAVVCLVVLTACAGGVTPAAGPATVGRPGVALPGGVPVGASTHRVASGGRVRSFIVYRPASVATRAPLVLMIHGGGGSAAGAEQRYGWDRAADRAGFLVAYPQGVQRLWNGAEGGCCGPAGTAGVDDVAFLTEMIASVEATVPVDPRRVFATGISEGGIMSYRLACSARLTAAIAPDSATLLGPCPSPAPVSVLHIHGSADHRIPFDGRPGDGVNHITGGPVPDVIARWRTVDGCAPPMVTSTEPVRTSTAECPGGRAVTLIEIDGAGHQWPGGEPSRPGRRTVTDPPSTALDATTTIWAFFAAHPAA